MSGSSKLGLKDLTHLTTEVTQEKVAVSSQVRALGRKAKERLEQERSKRREIIRLREQPLTSEVALRKNENVQDESSKKRRIDKRPVTNKRKPRPPRTKNTAKRQKIELGMPDVSNILIVSEENRSALVQLHGLPDDVRPEDIRRFFAGLDPERIVVLPTCDGTITEWDASLPRHGVDNLSDRPLRIFVKFVSAPVAFVATQRSGEVLRSVRATGDRMRVCVAVTQMDKACASFILRRMGIDGREGLSLRTMLDDVEERLHAFVVDILWSSTIEDLNLNLQTTKPEFQRLRLADHDINPVQLDGYQRLAVHHNSLVDKYESLEGFAALPAAFELDHDLFQDPVLRLTCHAAHVLLTEMRRIQHILHQARSERRQQALEISLSTC